jgi:hypothetical protein
VKFDGTNNFNTAVRIPFIKQDKFKIDEFIQIVFYLQSGAATVTPGDAVFMGECQLSWYSALDRPNGEWVTSLVPLTDPVGRSPLGDVTGQVKIFAKWIPIGHPDSKYDAQGIKRDGAPAPTGGAAAGGPVVPNRKEQQVGSAGKLEVYLRLYTHPSPLDPKEKYQVQVIMGEGGFNASAEKQVFTDGTNCSVRFFDVRTLAINSNSTESKLLIKVIAVSSGALVASHTFAQLQERLANTQEEFQYETVDFELPGEGTAKKGKMMMKVNFVPNEEGGGAPPVEEQAATLPPVPTKKPVTTIEEEKIPPIEQPPPTAPAKSQPSFVDLGEDALEDEDIPSPTPQKKAKPNVAAPPSTLKKESTILIEDT